MKVPNRTAKLYQQRAEYVSNLKPEKLATDKKQVKEAEPLSKEKSEVKQEEQDKQT